MFDLVQNILLIFFEILCCNIFFETFAKVRYKGWINVLQAILLMFIACIVGFSLSGSFILRQIAIIIMFALFMFWHVNIRIVKSFVLAFLYDTLLLVFDYLAYTVNSMLFSNNDVIEKFYTIEGTLVVLFGKVLLFLCILIIRKKLGEKSTDGFANTEWLKILFFPIFTIGIIAAMLSTFGYVETKEQANVLSIIAFGVTGMNIVVFGLINDIIERENSIHESTLFQLQMKNQMEMYSSISENFENQKRKTHEYKNQIICIESLLKRKQFSQLEEYVRNIYGDLNKETDFINTNNVIINAILNTKYQEALEKGIVFVFRINDLSDLCISDEDVVVILSNLLNNAIEACEKCIEKKVIKIKLKKDRNSIIIAVKNTFNHTICYKDEEIITTKLLRKEEHGVGIKNVIKIIDKYCGSYIIKTSNSEFHFSIIIPN